jgi:hypothetical protein
MTLGGCHPVMILYGISLLLFRGSGDAGSGSGMTEREERTGFLSSLSSSRVFYQEPGRAASERETWAQRAGTALPKDGFRLLDDGRLFSFFSYVFLTGIRDLSEAGEPIR